MARLVIGHPTIWYSQFHASAVFHLSDGATVDFLPRRLTGGNGRNAVLLALLPLRLADLHIAAAGVQIDADTVAGAQPGKATTNRALRRRIQYRRAVRGAALAAVTQRRQRIDDALDQRIGRLHVDHLVRTGPAYRAGAAYHQHAVLVDVQRRIVDAGVIIAGTVEHDGAGFEDVLAARRAQIAGAKSVRDHAGFHDGEVEQIALQDKETGVLLQRPVEGKDHLPVMRLAAGQVVAHAAAGDGGTVRTQHTLLLQLPHDGRHSTGAMETLAEEFTGRLHVQQQRHGMAVLHPVA